jgi:hypothetical protein
MLRTVRAWLERAALLPGPGVEPHQVGQHQRHAPQRAARHCGARSSSAQPARQFLEGAGPAGAGQVKLRQVPGRLRRQQLALRRPAAASQGAAGPARPGPATAGSASTAGRRAGRALPACSSPATGQHTPLSSASTRAACSGSPAHGRGRLARATTRARCGWPAAARPPAPAVRRAARPGRRRPPTPARRAWLGLQCKVQRGRLVEQPLFQQALQHGAQPGRTGGRALGQRDLVPGQGARRHHGHHFGTGAAWLRQQGRRRAAVLAHALAVGRQQRSRIPARCQQAAGEA